MLRCPDAPFLAAAALALPLFAGVLYDGGLGTHPGAQGSLGLFTNGLGVEVAGTFQRLNTSAANNIYAGYFNRTLTIGATPSVITPGAYFNPLFPTLDPTTGFNLHFTAQVVNETHTNPSRAAFSVILLGNDGKGVELGFQSNTILRKGSASSPPSPPRAPPSPPYSAP